MDITVNVDDYLLNVRTSGVLIHNNKILLHKNINEEHYALLGGRVAIGENSEEALRREIMEELGKEIEINGYVTTIENLFEMKGSKYYEILFVHNIEFKDEKDKNILETMPNKEGKEYLRYEWVDIDEFDRYDLRPKAMKKVLKEKQYTPYIINDDF